MSAGRLCVREVALAELGESVGEAARRMRDRGVGTLLVVDEATRPIGILTDRDLVLRVLAAGRDPGATRVAEVMTRSPRTVSETTPLEEALALMRSGAFRRVPVVDPDGRLAGVLSLDDVLGLLAEELAAVGALLERRAPRGAGRRP